MPPGVVLHEIGQLMQIFAWVLAINLTITTEGLVNQTRGSHLKNIKTKRVQQLCIKPTGLLVASFDENQITYGNGDLFDVVVNVICVIVVFGQSSFVQFQAKKLSSADKISSSLHIHIKFCLNILFFLNRSHVIFSSKSLNLFKLNIEIYFEGTFSL